ncbi:pur operon repressor [Lapidilactobacillus concavus DSM 17758]|uniref:Pur operon repressor n=1 Tax=Lapidilactobacillus concavus DSM 17758 TaxID=1423735 RepID=A0A0R1VTA0_9LACO|nr:pur operon repressor [Lapidilactobacillus concavus]KRM08645.1 pur operon repressor [Lapidilactobacillus concavus DSM 17758]GEL13136.1 pur operon repressor [Lapidilactobacillus concavus]
MKVKRSDRLIDMTNFLLDHPRQLVSLPFFVQRYNSAKSSISEDLAIIKRAFKARGLGNVQTLPGAAGGVEYFPGVSPAVAREFLQALATKLADNERLLPGGYLYLSDLLGNPNDLKIIGRLIAAQYAGQKVDAVMTVATKGIPIAQSVASYLGVPFVIARRDAKITEGATVSVNYVSASSDRIQKMELSKRSLSEGANVVIVDDFMKGGGTVRGMHDLLKEFNAHLVGITVFAEANFSGQRLVQDYTSLLKVVEIDTRAAQIEVQLGNYLDKLTAAQE